jgi:DNA-binding transcriptional LysR family regulator
MDRFLEMQTFGAVVDAGSFVKAADALDLSKAAVSRYVDALEGRLGARLLHRTTRRLSLTEEGQRFYARSKELLAGLEEAETEVNSTTVAATGHLRVNAPVTFGIRELGPLWGKFLALHPGVKLDITLSDRIVDLVEEGFDVAVRIAALGNSSLISKRLATTRIVLCATPKYLKARGMPKVPADLASHAIIAYSYFATRDAWNFDGPKGLVTVKTDPVVHTNSGDTCRTLALAHQGIILQPTFLVGGDLRTGALVELMPEFKAGELGIFAVYPSRKHVAAKVRALIDFLVAEFAGKGPSY